MPLYATKRIVFFEQTDAEPEELNALEPVRRVFLLSPADAGGKRAAQLLGEASKSDLSKRLRTTGAPLGEVFCFLSSLYFRGKLAYASAFAAPPAEMPWSLIITASRGLLPPDTIVTLKDVESFTEARIDAEDPRYRDPLERDLRRLSEGLGRGGQVVFLGSLATGKYVPLLREILGERLYYPRVFRGLGNMQRGNVLLTSSRGGKELEYVGAETPVPMKVRKRARG